MKERILYRQAIETARCLEEGVLEHVHDGNIGSVFGIGFPAWAVAAPQYVNHIGVKKFVKRADALAKKVGPRFCAAQAPARAAARASCSPDDEERSLPDHEEQILRLMSLPPILQKLRIPVIGAPMFIAGNPKLVIEQCKAGIVGSFPALNARPKEALDDWLTEIETALAGAAAARRPTR